MKTRAALHTRGQPLVIENVELDGRVGRSAGRDEGDACAHGRIHALGADPRAVPFIFGHEGAGVVSTSAGVTGLAKGDP